MNQNEREYKKCCTLAPSVEGSTACKGPKSLVGGKPSPMSHSRTLAFQSRPKQMSTDWDDEIEHSSSAVKDPWGPPLIVRAKRRDR